MNEPVYQLYMFGKKMIKMAEANWETLTESEKDFFSDLKCSHVILEEKRPDYPERYKREIKGHNNVLLPE